METALCHSYRLSPYNQENLTIFDKGKTLPWEGEKELFFDKKKKENSQIIQPSLQFYGKMYFNAAL